MKLISSCLVGCESTWRGTHNIREQFAELLRSGAAIPVCPEQMGGLPTPRPPAEIVRGSAEDVLDGRARVVTRDGVDVTAQYLKGAAETLRIARAVKAGLVVFQERSPSCGVRFVYDGTFSGRLVDGCGVVTALLRREGFAVVSDEEYLAAPDR